MNELFRHTWARIAAGIVALLAIVAIAIFFLVDANTFRPVIAKNLAQALNRPVTLGNLHLNPLSGSLVAQNIQIGDDQAYSQGPFLSAKTLTVGVEMGPLLFHKKLIVTSFTTSGASINLVHAADGTWNFSTIGQKNADKTAAASKDSAFPDLSVGKVAIEDATITVNSKPATGKPLVYDKVNLTATDFGFNKAFPYTFAANLPAEGTVSAKGTVGPISEDASNSPLTAALDIRHLDPVATGIVDASTGIAGLVDVKADIKSDGTSVTSKGTVHAVNLKLVQNGTPARKPIDIDYTVIHGLATRTGQISDVALKTGGVALHANGTYELKQQEPVVAVRATANNVSVDQLETLLPAVGIQPPSGSQLRGGQLTTTLDIRGPVNALVTSGPVQINGLEIVGFNVGQKLGPLSQLIGVKSGNNTTIQTLKGNITSGTTGTRADNIYALVQDLGSATGAGTVSPAGGLNFNLNVKPNITSGAGGQAIGLLANFAGGAANSLQSISKNGVGVTITGTTKDPHFGVDSASLQKAVVPSIGNSKNLQKSITSDPTGFLNGILGKRK